jgi:hypothetical protein
MKELKTLVLYKDKRSLELDIEIMHTKTTGVSKKTVAPNKEVKLECYYLELDYSETRTYICNPTLKDLFNWIAGHQFTGLVFLDGEWDHNIINYCLSRMRY